MRTFLAALVVLPYHQRVATRWGEIQAYAQLRGHPRPANDSDDPEEPGLAQVLEIRHGDT